MKRAINFYRQFFVAMCMVFALQACVTTPETPREAVAVAEIGYQEALDTATRWANEGRLDDGEKRQLTEAFDAYEGARNTARTAITAHDVIKNGGTLADLDLATITRLLGVSQQDLEAAEAAGQLVQLLAGKADSNASAVSLALINLRTILAEVE
ncbi:MAG: hypothetical protein OEQ39_04195 [Gammaproteobacteria bacterium]|nr:hypothetical protein [Gammaproteobacteria bacterium]MDH3466187.1 hypothetical protein [Gammaproteobacteria bacterium]